MELRKKSFKTKWEGTDSKIPTEKFSQSSVDAITIRERKLMLD
jgi:hypothetical protein